MDLGGMRIAGPEGGPVIAVSYNGRDHFDGTGALTSIGDDDAAPVGTPPRDGSIDEGRSAAVDSDPVVERRATRVDADSGPSRPVDTAGDEHVHQGGSMPNPVAVASPDPSVSPDPVVPGAFPQPDTGVDVEARAQEPVSIARFPSDLAGMAKVAEESRERRIDRATVASLINKRRYGPRAELSGRVASSHAEVAEAFTDADVDLFMHAAGLSQPDIDKIKATTYKSGLVYPGATLPGTLLQYVVAPYVSSAYGSFAGLGASAAAVLFSIPTAAMAQTSVITLSEHLAKGNGPFIEVDKSKIHYETRLSQASAEANAASQHYAATAAEFNKHTGHLAAMSEAQRTEYLSALPIEERELLRQLSTAVIDARADLHTKQEQLLTTQGGLQRQKEGTSNQLPVRVLRSPLSTLWGLLSGVSPQVAATTGLRTQILTSTQLYGSAVALNLILQGVGHYSAARDEYSKVKFKVRLNIMYADLFNDEGREHWEQGKEITEDDIDPKQVRKLFSSPPEAIGKVVHKLFTSQLASVADAQKDALQAQLDLLKAHRFDQLDPDHPIAEAMLAASSPQRWLNLVGRESWSKYTASEIQAQHVQRTSQTFHGAMFGGAGSVLLPRGITAHFGGSSHTPRPVTGALAVVSGLFAYIGAATQYKSAVQKNNNKEVKPPYSVPRQLSEGMRAGYLLIKEDNEAERAGQRGSQTLAEHQRTAGHARTLRATLDATDRPAAPPAATTGQPPPPQPAQPHTGDTATAPIPIITVTAPDGSTATTEPSSGGGEERSATADDGVTRLSGRGGVFDRAGGARVRWGLGPSHRGALSVSELEGLVASDSLPAFVDGRGELSEVQCESLAGWLIGVLHPEGVRGGTVDDSVVGRGGVAGARKRVLANGEWGRVRDVAALKQTLADEPGSSAVVMFSRGGGRVGHVQALYSTAGQGLWWVDPQRSGSRVFAEGELDEAGLEREFPAGVELSAVVLDAGGRVVSPEMWSSAAVSTHEALLDAPENHEFGAHSPVVPESTLEAGPSGTSRAGLSSEPDAESPQAIGSADDPQAPSATSTPTASPSLERPVPPTASGDLWSTYSRVPTALSDTLTRNPLPSQDLETPGYQFLGHARSSEGGLSDVALQQYSVGAELERPHRLKRFDEARYVISEGIDDNALRQVLEQDPFYGEVAPELHTHLARADGGGATDQDGRSVVTVSEVVESGVRVQFRQLADDPTAPRRRATLLRALSALSSAGYPFPARLEVNLVPRSFNIEPSTAEGELLEISEAHAWQYQDVADTGFTGFLPPNGLDVTSSPAAQRASDNGWHGGVAEAMMDADFVGMLGDLIHVSHYQHSPEVFADLLGTTFTEQAATVAKQVGKFAARDPYAFVAEYGVIKLLGQHTDDSRRVELDRLYEKLGGPLADVDVPALPAPPLTDEQLDALVGEVRKTPLRSDVTAEQVKQADEALAPALRWLDVVPRAKAIAIALEEDDHRVSTAYQDLDPALREFIVRKQLTTAELTGYEYPVELIDFARTPDGTVSQAARKEYAKTGQRHMNLFLHPIFATAGVTVDGDLDDVELAALFRADAEFRRKYPEVESYLDRADDSAHTDRNDPPIVETVLHDGVQVRMHLGGHDDSIRRSQTTLLTALSALVEGGYALPKTLDVYLPRYVRSLTLRPVLDEEGRRVLDDAGRTKLDVEIRELGAQQGLIAEFWPPHHVFVFPRRKVGNPPQGDGSVTSAMEDFALGYTVHELMHWLHFQHRGGQYLDSELTDFLPAAKSTAGQVSDYAATNPREFVAEYGMGQLFGRRYDSETATSVHAMYEAFGGPMPAEGSRPLVAPPLDDEHLDALVLALGWDDRDRALAAELEAKLEPFDRWRFLPDRALLVEARLADEPAVSAEPLVGAQSEYHESDDSVERPVGDTTAGTPLQMARFDGEIADQGDQFAEFGVGAGPVSPPTPTADRLDRLVAAVRQRSGTVEFSAAAIADAERRLPVFDRQRRVEDRAALIADALTGGSSPDHAWDAFTVRNPGRAEQILDRLARMLPGRGSSLGGEVKEAYAALTDRHRTGSTMLAVLALAHHITDRPHVQDADSEGGETSADHRASAPASTAALGTSTVPVAAPVVADGGAPGGGRGIGEGSGEEMGSVVGSYSDQRMLQAAADHIVDTARDIDRDAAVVDAMDRDPLGRAVIDALTAMEIDPNHTHIASLRTAITNYLVENPHRTTVLKRLLAPTSERIDVQLVPWDAAVGFDEEAKSLDFEQERQIRDLAAVVADDAQRRFADGGRVLLVRVEGGGNGRPFMRSRARGVGLTRADITRDTLAREVRKLLDERGLSPEIVEFAGAQSRAREIPDGVARSADEPTNASARRMVVIRFQDGRAVLPDVAEQHRNDDGGPDAQPGDRRTPSEIAGDTTPVGGVDAPRVPRPPVTSQPADEGDASAGRADVGHEGAREVTPPVSPVTLPVPSPITDDPSSTYSRVPSASPT
ncbi:hypothetical protein, partial [Mycolicibacterium arabiense]|uniref:hypothetical protein n=1 Tax=Mycolicibacterium arabiense TaxID=1286181 RepID=UPI0021F29B1A